jgi:hypothetical protein
MVAEYQRTLVKIVAVGHQHSASPVVRVLEPALQVRRALQVVRPGRPLHAGLGGRPVLAIQPHLWVLRVRAGPVLRAHPESPAFLSGHVRPRRPALQVVRPGQPLHAGLGGRPVLAIQPHLGVPLVREDLARRLVLVVRPYLEAQEGLRCSNLSGSNFLGTAPPAPQLSNRR